MWTSLQLMLLYLLLKYIQWINLLNFLLHFYVYMKVCRDTMVHVHRSKDNLCELALFFHGVSTGTNSVPRAWKQAPAQLSQSLRIALDSY